MPIAAVLLVLTSSVFHVAWNSLVKTSGDPLATATRAVGLGVLAVTPIAILAWFATGRPTLTQEGWLIALASGVVSAAYFVPLSAAYRRGALSSVYPVARGSGALLGVVAGVVLLGEQLAPAGTLGVVLLLGGTLTAAAATASRSTVAPALLAGCAVAGYSALDRVGVRTGPAWLYAWALWSVCAIGLQVWRHLMVTRPVRVRMGTARGAAPGGAGDAASAGAASVLAAGAMGVPPAGAGDATVVGAGGSAPAGDAAVVGAGDAALEGPGDRAPAGAGDPASEGAGDAADLRRSLAAGLLIIGTYMLILLAFQIAPLAGVAPLREATTILAAAWGVVVLGERDRAGVRLAAAAAVALGAVLLAIGG